jgi:hypothetical protein
VLIVKTELILPLILSVAPELLASLHQVVPAIVNCPSSHEDLTLSPNKNHGIFPTPVGHLQVLVLVAGPGL